MSETVFILTFSGSSLCIGLPRFMLLAFLLTMMVTMRLCALWLLSFLSQIRFLHTYRLN